MQRIRNRWLALLGLVLVVGGPIAWFKRPLTASANAPATAHVRQGALKVIVMPTGELRARKFVQIQGPNSQNAEIYQTKISWIVPEGTIVTTGEKVAELDRAPAEARLVSVTLDTQKAEAAFTNAVLDTAITLSSAREDIRTAEYSLEERKLVKEQARYEAPAIQRQAQIDYEKAQRAVDQAKRSFDAKTQQAVAKLSIASADLGRQQNNLKMVQESIDAFTIMAPSSGMVIYIREWDGKKKGIGSRYYAWSPTVATLPDLREMESQTYVNEVDIQRVAVGQKVTVSVDADPSKRLAGVVSAVANVGEQRPNQDSKVFEVRIDLTQSDTALRPGMTSANAIEVASIPNALSIPLAAVVRDDGYSYVYKRSGRQVVRQMIETGPANDLEVVVRKGLAKDDVVLLSTPPDHAKLTTEIIPGLRRTQPPRQGVH